MQGTLYKKRKWLKGFTEHSGNCYNGHPKTGFKHCFFFFNIWVNSAKEDEKNLPFLTGTFDGI